MNGRLSAYKLAVFEILRDFFVLAYITCPCYPYRWSLPTLRLRTCVTGYNRSVYRGVLLR